MKDKHLEEVNSELSLHIDTPLPSSRSKGKKGKALRKYMKVPQKGKDSHAKKGVSTVKKAAGRKKNTNNDSNNNDAKNEPEGKTNQVDKHKRKASGGNDKRMPNRNKDYLAGYKIPKLDKNKCSDLGKGEYMNITISNNPDGGKDDNGDEGIKAGQEDLRKSLIQKNKQANKGPSDADLVVCDGLDVAKNFSADAEKVLSSWHGLNRKVIYISAPINCAPLYFTVVNTSYILTLYMSNTFTE